MKSPMVKYRPEIDGLRALAVLAVIFYHFEISFFNKNFFSGGYLGVDIFFVISGYLITSILTREYETTKSISIFNFYERRIRRIIPLLFTVILASTPFAWFYLMPSSLVDFSKSALSSIVFSSNFYFHFSENAYFNFNDSNPLLHTWSLSVEEQFYIFFPFFILFVIKFFKNSLLKIFIIIIILNLLVVNFAGNLSLSYPFIEEKFSIQKPSFFGSFYIFTSRLWELLMGACLVFFEKNSKLQKLKVYNILPKIGLVIILVSILLFNESTFHPSFLTLIPVLGICLIIFFSNKKEYITKILSSKILVNLGLISYSLYLWHYPFLIFKKNTTDNENNLLIFFLIFIISLLSYKFIEKPFRNKTLTSYKQTLVFIFIIAFAICLSSLNFLSNKGYSERYNFEFENYKLDNKIYSDEWSLKQKNILTSKKIFDPKNYNNNILIVGNSHGQDLFNFFDLNKDLYREYNFLFSNIRGGKDLLNFFRNSNNCESFSENLFPLIAEFSDKNNQKICNAKYLIIANRYNHWDLDYLEEIIEISKKIKKELILVLIKPHFNTYGELTILDKFILKKRSLPNKNEIKFLEQKYYDSQKNNKYINDMNSNLIKIGKNKDIKILNLKELLCDEINQKCQILTNEKDKIVYDSSHFSIDGAKHLGKKAFEVSWLQKIIK